MKAKLTRMRLDVFLHCTLGGFANEPREPEQTHPGHYKRYTKSDWDAVRKYYGVMPIAALSESIDRTPNVIRLMVCKMRKAERMAA